MASRSGYFSDSTELSTLGLLEPKNLSARLNLKAIPVPPPPPPPPPPPVRPTIALHNIYWDFNKAIVRGDAALSLDTVARVLAENADLVVEVASHTDALGANNYNKILAEKRTKTTAQNI